MYDKHINLCLTHNRNYLMCKKNAFLIFCTILKDAEVPGNNLFSLYYFDLFLCAFCSSCGIPSGHLKHQ